MGVLDADLNGPSMAKVLGVRGQRLRLSSEGVHPAEGPLAIKVLSMDLFRPMARMAISRYARERGVTTVTPELMDEYRTSAGF